jgi:hypothetical protein
VYRTIVLVIFGFFVATVCLPAVLAFVLQRTPAWWLPAVALAGFGVYLLSTIDQTEHKGAEGASGALGDGLGNVFQKAYGVFMLVYAALLWVSARRRRKAPAPIPPAKVV